MGDRWISGAFGIQSYVIPLATTPNLLFRLLMIGVLTLPTSITLFSLWRWVKNTRKNNHRAEFTSHLVVGIILGLLSLAIYIAGVLGLYNYNPKAGLMLLVLLVLAFVFWRLEFLVQSPWGRVLKAIREDEEVPRQARSFVPNQYWKRSNGFTHPGPCKRVGRGRGYKPY